MTKKEANEVGKKIKKAMQEAYLNQAELAEKLKLDQAQVSNWIRGSRNPKTSSLKKIAEVTGKPLNYFFDNSTKISGIRDNSSVAIGSNNIGSSSDIELLKKDVELIRKEMQVLHLEIELLKTKK